MARSLRQTESKDLRLFFANNSNTPAVPHPSRSLRRVGYRASFWSRQSAANAQSAAELLPSDYKLYGPWRAGSTGERGVFVDKGVRNYASWNFLKKQCIIGIFLGVSPAFCTATGGRVWTSLGAPAPAFGTWETANLVRSRQRIHLTSVTLRVTIAYDSILPPQRTETAFKEVSPCR